jgi:hypothetical protein
VAIPGNFLSESTSSMDPSISGWTAKLNCTLNKGTGGRVGDGCLVMKSVAAGEMQCRTVASYPVAPWTEYEVFADAAGGTVPERIGIRWLTSSSTEISISWSMTTATASASWHRIAVADVAPEAAAFAQVVFSSTPAAANVNSFLENVYLGLPVRTTGNLLVANAENSERASAWEYTAGTNCTLSRTVPAVSWSATVYQAGGHVATMTVTSSGDADFRSTDQPTVTPGQEYLATAYLNPPTSASTAWIELRFYDASHAQIQATRANLAAPGTGWYRQAVSDVAPATAAFASVAFGLTGATAGQVLRTDTAVITAASALVAGSVVPYRDASFEAGVGGWTVVSGAAVLSRSTPWGSFAVDGSYALTISSATATTSVIRSGLYPIPEVVSYRSQMGVYVSAGGWTITRALRWYDSSGVSISLTSDPAGTAPTPGWWYLSNDFTAPPGAAKVAFEWTLTATAASSVLRADKAAIWEALPLTEVIAVDSTGSVTVTFRELTVGQYMTLWRVVPDGTRTLVRGANGLINREIVQVSQVVIEDYEAPLGVPVYYYLELFDEGDQTPDTRSSSTVTIDPGDVNEIWLKDPGNPQRNMRLMVEAAPDWDRPIVQAEYRVRRRRNSVVLSDVRGGLEGALSIWTRTDAERAAVHRLLDPGTVLLWQAAPGMGVDDMYVNVGQVQEARITSYAPEQWRAWVLPLRQADMPVTVGVASSAGRTWQDILTENSTWADVLAKYATWEDVLFNRPIGG